MVRSQDGGSNQVLDQEMAVDPDYYIDQQLKQPILRLFENVLEDAEKQTPGLWVCGNYKSGVAFPDCVTFGYEHAKEVAAFLDN